MRLHLTKILGLALVLATNNAFAWGHLYIHNASGSQAVFNLYIYSGANCTGTSGYINNYNLAPGATADEYQNWNPGWYVGFIQSGQTCCTGVQLNGNGPWDVFFNGIGNCGSGSGTPATTNYYVWGCVTNNSGHHRRYTLTGGGTSSQSGVIAPNGWFCWPTITNNSPFTYTIDVEEWGPDGQVNTTTGGPWPAWTNTVPGTAGATGGLVDTGQPPNPNGGSGMGQGNTGNLTGDQYAGGVSNLLSAIRGGLQNVAGAVWRTGTNGATSGNGTNYDPTASAYLRAISNNTTIANALAEATTNALAGTNGILSWLNRYTSTNADWKTNAEAWLNGQGSNAVWSMAGTASNLVHGAFTNATPQSLANEPIGWDTSPDAEGFWSLPIYMTVQGWLNKDPNARYNLDPNQNTAPIRNVYTGMAPFIRLFITWILSLGAIFYIKNRVEMSIRELLHVPGCGPQHASLALAGISAVTGTAITTTVIAAAPLILASALETVITIQGGPLAFPMTAAGTALAGGHQNSVLAGVHLFETFFPTGMFITLVIYLMTFDALIISNLVWGALLWRRLT